MRILVVGPDALIDGDLKLGLHKEGFAVDSVRDAESAMLALRMTSYGLVLFDIGLSGDDGLILLARLRQRNDATSVIVTTPRHAVPKAVAGLDGGADDYIVKPFALDELLARIRVVIRHQTGRVQPLLQAGALRLDPAQHRVWLRDKEVSVTTREFALLQELMRDPTIVVTRAQLEERLYGWNEEIESNAIQVHVHNLRRKLGGDAIHNVRGVGYRIGKLA
ncbi:response regulator [Paraburkholderia sp. CNPSo 3157]|uniref:Response regulator n=1 Tax=Paraburkholderia franconis TaxID=2654983 RepID=A0A7X1NHH0_9BURK|nr:winged helix-turn-helix domain-containing protein [Paraburkholderia franconis]MPW22067.1 response regulator [Paraburkholderia franconis]